MKAISLAIKVLIVILANSLLVICVSELINFLQKTDNYFIGSEAMIEHGGWPYSSDFAYIFFNSFLIIMSILLSFLAVRSHNIKHLILLLLLVICQIGYLIIL